MLVSSHLMSELQETADHLVIVGRGRVIADTSVADLIASASGDRVTVRTAAPLGGGDRALAARGRRCRRRRRHPRVSRAARGADRGRAGCGPGAVLRGDGAPGDLEEAYMELTRDAVEYRASPPREAAR